MLARVVRRTLRAERLKETIVATTDSTKDDPIVRLCTDRGWPYERGSEDDVLDRYYRAAKSHRADVVVRITSDCPLIDPGLIDEAVEALLRTSSDYVSNGLEPRTYPRGLDVEVFPFSALSQAWREDRNLMWREHVTPYLYRHPERFRLHRLAHDRDLSFFRWTVDTPEDYELVRRIYGHFRGDDFRWMEVLDLLDRHPEWQTINRNVKQKVVP